MSRISIITLLLAFGCSEPAPAPECPPPTEGRTPAAAAPGGPAPVATIGDDAVALAVPPAPHVGFTVEQPGEYQVDVHGADERDVRLALYFVEAGVEELVGYDDDSGDGNDARLSGFLPSGAYEARIQEYGSRAVDAAVRVHALPPLEVTGELVVGGEPLSVAVTDGASERESASEVSFRVSEPGQFTVAAEPVGLSDPKIRLLRVHEGDRLEQLGSDDDSGRNRVARIDYQLPAGEYRVRVFSSRRRPGRRQVFALHVGPREPMPTVEGTPLPDQR